MRKDILKNLSRVNDEVIPKKCIYKQQNNNIFFSHTHRDELVITKKSTYTYEELIVYLHSLDSLWEEKLQIKSSYIS